MMRTDGSGGVFPLALGGGVRLGSQRLGIEVGGFAPAAQRPAKRGAVGGLALAEQQVVRLALDSLAMLEAEGFRCWAPPAAGRLSPGFAAWM
jgi:hypothetical protein